MISIKDLQEKDKGKEVMYTSFGSREYGYITSWNDKYIFVRYHTKVWDSGKREARTGQTPESTRPEDLSFCFERKEGKS